MSCAYVLVIPSDYRALDKRSPMIASCRRFWFTFGGRGIAMHGAFKFVAIFGVGFSLASHTPLPAFPASTLDRSEEHTSELQSLMRISYAVFCLKKKKYNKAMYRS